MADLAIQVSNLSKRYRVGGRAQTYQTLRESLVGAFSPNRNSSPKKKTKENSGSIWALNEISFEVNSGEVLGVIGRNGAGKSTLLKILSRITRPTHGQIRLIGRVGSLLEVGTGFHPELTGRENIYLNGAILGMKRTEINHKFDAIVDFAEIEQFLDTPVKRYSSGMYMRLAFAVAAHLEPEILLVDEVLAVGDVAFQKKCLGRMGQVAGDGRTVLFVSHNMGAIRSLCPRSILLSEGKIVVDGPSLDAIAQYLKYAEDQTASKAHIQWSKANDAPGSDELRLSSMRLISSDGKTKDQFDVNETVCVEFIYQVYQTIRGMRFVLVVNTNEGVLVFASTDHHQRPYETLPGLYRSTIKIPGGLFNRTGYTIQLHAGIPGQKVILKGKDFLSFTCIGTTDHGSSYPEDWPGIIAPKIAWEVDRFDQ